MKRLISLGCLCAVFAVSTPVFASGEKMKGCSKEAAGMKGEERKAFMKKCLSKDYALKSDKAAPAAPAAAAPATSAAASTQQDRMKACNADAKAKGLAGEERKKFMSTCLKG